MDKWKVSLHGGHSGDYCDHAEGGLREILDAAVRFGYHTFGVSEHAPRLGESYLYDKERELGWTVAKIVDDFERYALDIPGLAAEYADRLIVLRGFETEVVPDDYPTIMKDYRERKQPDGTPVFEYMVGSVHFINGYSIDGPLELFQQALHSCGDIVELAREYYRQVGRMVETLRPDVVGHFDLIKLNTLKWRDSGSVSGSIVPDTAALRAVLDAGEQALQAVRDCNGILDLNTAAWRKGLSQPYPDMYWIEKAHGMGIPFCFGDDSHRVEQVGYGVERARQFLLERNIPAITVLTKEERAANAPVVRRVVSLE